VDASPTRWEGSGLVVSAEHDRATAKRLHRFTGSFEQLGGFVFRTPLGTTARSPDDGAIRLGGEYEYRRYFFRDLWFRGFDVGIGVAGGARYESLVRHFEPAIEVNTSGTDFTVAGVVAARLTRWRRVQLEVDWANGGAIGQRTTTHSSAAQTEVAGWGGGWLTDLSVRGDVRVSDRMSVFGSYFRTGRGRFSTHLNAASGWRQFLMGIAYGR
jgi:hypothetical protein